MPRHPSKICLACCCAYAVPATCTPRASCSIHCLSSPWSPPHLLAACLVGLRLSPLPLLPQLLLRLLPLLSTQAALHLARQLIQAMCYTEHHVTHRVLRTLILLQPLCIQLFIHSTFVRLSIGCLFVRVLSHQVTKDTTEHCMGVSGQCPPGTKHAIRRDPKVLGARTML